jgi:hypothetical protein
MLPDFIVDYKTFFAVVAILISVGCFVNYARSVFKLQTKPHAYTWLVWCITQGTAVAALWYGHGGWGAVALTLSTVFVFSVFLLSLKYGTRNITKSDTTFLILALLAIIVWWKLDNPFLAVIMVSVIDVIGYIPSWRKSMVEPWSEAISSWSASVIGTLFAVLALTEYNFFTITYPAALAAGNIILVVICLIYRTKIPRPENRSRLV